MQCALHCGLAQCSAAKDPTSQFWELTHGGKVIKGWVREPSDGSAIGCIYMKNREGLSAVKSTSIASSSFSSSAQLEDVFKTASSKVQVNSTATGGSSSAKVMRTRNQFKAKAGEEDSDDDFNLDMILGKHSLRRPGKGGGEPAEKVARTGSGGGGGAASSSGGGTPSGKKLKGALGHQFS